MKTISKLAIIAILTLSFFSSAFSTNPKFEQTQTNWTKAEKNYIAALGSDNIGVRESAAGYIAKYQLKGAVSELINLLRTDKSEQIRMASAEALIQLGDTNGRTAVSEAALYDGSEKVAKFCEQLMRGTAKENS